MRLSAIPVTAFCRAVSTDVYWHERHGVIAEDVDDFHRDRVTAWAVILVLGSDQSPKQM